MNPIGSFLLAQLYSSFSDTKGNEEFINSIFGGIKDNRLYVSFSPLLIRGLFCMTASIIFLVSFYVYLDYEKEYNHDNYTYDYSYFWYQFFFYLINVVALFYSKRFSVDRNHVYPDPSHGKYSTKNIVRKFFKYYDLLSITTITVLFLCQLIPWISIWVIMKDGRYDNSFNGFFVLTTFFPAFSGFYFLLKVLCNLYLSEPKFMDKYFMYCEEISKQKVEKDFYLRLHKKHLVRLEKRLEDTKREIISMKRKIEREELEINNYNAVEHVADNLIHSAKQGIAKSYA